VKILVTGAGALLGQGIIRSLQKSALDAHIVAVDPNPLSAGLYWADAARLVPPASAPHYIDVLKEILSADRPDVLIPGTDVELGILAEARQSLEDEFGTHVLVSNPEVVRIADDKWLTAQFFRTHGFGYVPSCLPGDEDSLIDEVGFPLIVKPRIGARSIGFSRIGNREELRLAIATQPGLVIQKQVGAVNQEFTAGTLTFNGGCGASIVMRRDLRDGNTYRAFVEPFAKLNDVVVRAAECLGAYGPANFQFMLDGGEVKIFEINARFSGTTPLRAIAGFNEVEMAIRHIMFGTPIRQPAIEPTVILRHWSETTVRPGELVGTTAGRKVD
jgi:carbamoyl-phosphate synthase large subunit